MFARTIARRGPILALALGLLAACGQPTTGGPSAVLPTVIAIDTQPAPATVMPIVAQAAPTTAASTTQPAPATAQPAVAQPPAPVANSSAPQRIGFAPGATGTTVEGVVLAGERMRYVLWAGAGQQMDVTLSSPEQNGALVMAGPGGVMLPGAEPGRDAAAWSGLLPANGDYSIEIGPTRGNLAFRLAISIITPAPVQPLRTANWPAVFANDPALGVEQQNGKLRVSVIADPIGVGGFPALSEIVYGDLDGDGREEAAIPLNSGGTAGNIGLLVYRELGGAPVLAAWLRGYKQYVRIENGLLLVREPIYGSNDPNCCPSGFATTSYLLHGSQLAVVERREEGLPVVQLQPTP